MIAPRFLSSTSRRVSRIDRRLNAALRRRWRAAGRSASRSLSFASPLQSVRVALSISVVAGAVSPHRRRQSAQAAAAGPAVRVLRPLSSRVLLRLRGADSATSRIIMARFFLPHACVAPALLCSTTSIAALYPASKPCTLRRWIGAARARLETTTPRARAPRCCGDAERTLKNWQNNRYFVEWLAVHVASRTLRRDLFCNLNCTLWLFMGCRSGESRNVVPMEPSGLGKSRKGSPGRQASLVFYDRFRPETDPGKATGVFAEPNVHCEAG